MSVATETVPREITREQDPYTDVLQPVAGRPEGKHFLSIRQLDVDDIDDYLVDAYAAEQLVDDASRRGITLLPHAELKAVMRQPSTRTGGSMATAMDKLGGKAQVISGMAGSSEAKGESLADSWIAFATQADIIGARTAENEGPAFAARAIETAMRDGKLKRTVPVINLGDGKNEHPTQALGDLFTIHKKFGRLEGLTMAVVGDHERYRAFHSLLLAAAKVGMTVIAVESIAAPVPINLSKELGSSLERTDDLDEAMRHANVLYMGRCPDEYDGKDDLEEEWRSHLLAEAYAGWRVDYDRLQQMDPNGIVLHPRPRKNELDPSIDSDPRAWDVEQMAHMIPMRMAIIARHLSGLSIRNEVRAQEKLSLAAQLPQIR